MICILVSSSLSFSHLKNCYKTQIHILIKLKFSKYKEQIKANLNTYFGANPMEIYRVIIIFFCKAELILLLHLQGEPFGGMS